MNLLFLSQNISWFIFFRTHVVKVFPHRTDPRLNKELLHFENNKRMRVSVLILTLKIVF